MRPGAAGVAPESSRITPAAKVAIAKTRGTSSGSHCARASRRAARSARCRSSTSKPAKSTSASDQRDQVVDDAVGERRAEHRVARAATGASSSTSHRLEHAEPGGHVAHEPRDLREQEDADETREVEARGGRAAARRAPPRRALQSAHESSDLERASCAGPGSASSKPRTRSVRRRRSARDHVGGESHEEGDAERPRGRDHRMPRRGEADRVESERERRRARGSRARR